VTNPIVIASAASAHLQPADLDLAPIPKSWILSGAPEARNKRLANSHDRTSSIVVWDCTIGHFNWHYVEDETLVVLSGEAFITNDRGEERRLAAGDMGFFPAGSSATWRVTSRVRKVAILRRTIPRPVVFGVRVWGRFLRMVGLRPQPISPLASLFLPWIEQAFDVI